MGPLDGAAADGSVLDESAADESAADESAVDGNAIGGLLIDVFGTEMTTALGICGNCSATSQIAEMAVYLHGLGTVVRCRGCDSVLMVFVQVREVTCVDLEGLASLTPS